MDDETYLGDGLYARFDGHAIWLRAPRENGDHVVALEPEVLSKFLWWLAEMKRAHGAIPSAKATP